jgi:hypothetical protein
MQILMGAHSTIVTINESKVHTKNLIHFIQTNMNSYTQHKNSITLNHSPQEYYERVFLLKWLYTLHTKVTKKSVPNLKELLVRRVDKPIKIEFKNRIEKQLCVNVNTTKNNTIQLSLNRSDFYLFADFKLIIKKQITIFSIKSSYIEIELIDENINSQVKKMFSYENAKEHDIFFIYEDKNSLDILLNPKPIRDDFQNALMLLNSEKNDSIKSIKTRYKKLLKFYHPDNVFEQSSEKEYTKRFQTIQNAYSLIKQQLSS